MLKKDTKSKYKIAKMQACWQTYFDNKSNKVNREKSKKKEIELVFIDYILFGGFVYFLTKIIKLFYIKNL